MTPQENELMNENDDLVKRLDTLDKMFEQLRLENLEKKQNIENLNKENKYLCIQNSELNDDNCYLDKKIEQLTNEKTTLKTYLKQQNKQFKKLETTITNLKKDCSKLEKEKKQVEFALEKKQYTLTQTQSELKDKESYLKFQKQENVDLSSKYNNLRNNEIVLHQTYLKLKEEKDKTSESTLEEKNSPPKEKKQTEKTLKQTENQLTKEINENENLKQHDLTITKDEEINISDRKEIKEKNVFELDYVPSKNALFKSYLVSIPTDYNKDVYYFDYQNRQELFGSSKHDHIPVYFPIPVLKGETYTIFSIKPKEEEKKELVELNRDSKEKEKINLGKTKIEETNKKELNELKKKESDLVEQKKQLEKTLKQTKDQLTKKTNEVITKSKKLAKLEENIKKSEKELNEKDKTIKRKEEDLKKFEKKLDTTTKEKEKLMKENDHLRQFCNEQKQSIKEQNDSNGPQIVKLKDEEIMKLKKENDHLRQQLDLTTKNDELTKLKQENNDLIKEMNEKLNEKEKEIEGINVEKIKGSCEEEKVGEMIKTMTQRKLLTFTNELTKSRHSSQLSQQLILNSSSFIIPITIFEFYNGCTKMITVPFNGNNILKEVIIDKCDNHLIREVNGKTIIIEVQQHNHITYDRKNEITIFMIKRSEISQDIQIRHPCGNYFDMPKKGSEITNYKASDGTEIQIRIIDDNKFDEEMKRYYDILNGVKQQKHVTLEKVKENAVNKRSEARIPDNQKQIRPREDIQLINQSRPIQEREINGKTISFIQDDIDFISLKKTGNPNDLLCVTDLTYCEGNTNFINIHTPNGIVNYQITKDCMNGGMVKMEDVIGKSIGIDLKATFYVSFIQSFVKNDNNVFDYNYELCKHNNHYRMFKKCEVKIPTNYNKDVYYWDYQNRQELFGYSQYNNIPVYFLIPVLKGENYSVFFYVKKSSKSSCEQLLQLNVVAKQN
ncbi:hypothetical protein QTN25_004867 [Entamoeba marina]